MAVTQRWTQVRLAVAAEEWGYRYPTPWWIRIWPESPEDAAATSTHSAAIRAHMLMGVQRQLGARTARNGVRASPHATNAKMEAATRKVGSIPQVSASMPASGAVITMTARLKDRSVVLVRAWSSSGVMSWR